MSVEKISDKCLGCTLCLNICPTKAISVFVNKNQEEYVKVDDNKCIQCGKCEKLCPVFDMLNIKSSNQLRCAYSAYAKEEYTKKSSSGAVFYSIAKNSLDRNWYICGAVYTDHYRSVKHILTNKITDVMMMRGSKYVQSSIRDLYYDFKNILNNAENIILFCGTPCQCAAIKSFFSKYINRIYLIELVCNGCMPPIILRKDIEEIELNNGSSVENYTMRYKYESYFPIFKKVDLKNGKNIVEDFYKTDIGAIYGSRICLRKCCYHCQY